MKVWSTELVASAFAAMWVWSPFVCPGLWPACVWGLVLVEDFVYSVNDIIIISRRRPVKNNGVCVRW